MNNEVGESKRQTALKEVFKEHENMLQELDQAFSERLEQAEAKFLSTIDALNKSMADEEEEAKQDVDKPTNVPAAVWMEVNGEHMLVLNQAAAVQQLALLDRLQEVLAELAKLAPKKAARIG